MQKVLIVDDSEAIRSILTTFFYYIDSHLNILQATNGLEAVAIAETQKPDLILMDGNMPQMNGVDAIRTLMDQENTRLIPIIGMTSNFVDSSIRQELQKYCAKVLKKPFNYQELRTIMQEFTPSPVASLAG